MRTRAQVLCPDTVRLHEMRAMRHPVVVLKEGDPPSVFTQHVAYVRDDDAAQFGDALLVAVRAYLLMSDEETARREAEVLHVCPVTDARRGGLVGQDGVFARRAIERGTVLVEYGGLVTLFSAHGRRSVQHLRRESDEKTLLLTHLTTWDDPMLGIVKEEGVRDRVVIDGHFHSNIGSKFNDYRLDPFAERGAARAGTPEPLPNVTFVELLIGGWPHTFVVAERDVAPGDELTVDYGPLFWDALRIRGAFAEARPPLLDNGRLRMDRLVDLLARL